MSPILQPDLREAGARAIAEAAIVKAPRRFGIESAATYTVERVARLVDRIWRDYLPEADAILALVSSTGWSGDQSSVVCLPAASLTSPSLANEPATPSEAD